MAKFNEAEHLVRSESQFTGNVRDASEIILNAEPYERHEDRCCIYVLLDGNTVVYVGQTSNLASRLATHVKTKKFTRFWHIDCPRDELSSAEAAYIVALNPTLNAALPSNSEYVLHNSAKRMIGDGIKLRSAVRSGMVRPIRLNVGLVYRVSEINAAISAKTLNTGKVIR